MIGKRAITEEDLGSLLDGELDSACQVRVLEAIVQDPDLLKRLRADSRIARRLREMNAEVLDEPVPQRFLDLLDALDDSREKPEAVD